jgi:hypothetical protein
MNLTNIYTFAANGLIPPGGGRETSFYVSYGCHLSLHEDID